MFWALATLTLLGSYLLGSIPFALLLGWSRGVDIRTVGSGNPGATNLGRALGRRWAVAAFLLDFGKGLAPVVSAQLLPLAAEETTRNHLAIGCGAAAVCGHVFSVFLRFRGGKGVATTFGVMAALAWIASLAAGAVWGVIYLLTRVVSLASLAAAVCLPAVVILTHRKTILQEHLGLLIVSLALALMVVWRHRDNVSRLLAGKELGFRGRGGPPTPSSPSRAESPDPSETNERPSGA